MPEWCQKSFEIDNNRVKLTIERSSKLQKNKNGINGRYAGKTKETHDNLPEKQKCTNDRAVIRNKLFEINKWREKQGKGIAPEKEGRMANARKEGAPQKRSYLSDGLGEKVEKIP